VDVARGLRLVVAAEWWMLRVGVARAGQLRVAA